MRKEESAGFRADPAGVAVRAADVSWAGGPVRRDDSASLSVCLQGWGD